MITKACNFEGRKELRHFEVSESIGPFSSTSTQYRELESVDCLAVMEVSYSAEIGSGEMEKKNFYVLGENGYTRIYRNFKCSDQRDKVPVEEVRDEVVREYFLDVWENNRSTKGGM